MCQCGARDTNSLVEEFILIRCVSMVSGTLIFGGRVCIDKVCKYGVRDTDIWWKSSY